MTALTNYSEGDSEVPWAGAQITDFNAGDVLDLTGLVASTGYTGSNPFEAGYLKIALVGLEDTGQAGAPASPAAGGTP